MAAAILILTVCPVCNRYESMYGGWYILCANMRDILDRATVVRKHHMICPECRAKKSTIGEIAHG